MPHISIHHEGTGNDDPKKQIIYHHMLYENKLQNQLAKGTPFPVVDKAISPDGE